MTRKATALLMLALSALAIAAAGQAITFGQLDTTNR
jgi:hypothetical protein